MQDSIVALNLSDQVVGAFGPRRPAACDLVMFRVLLSRLADCPAGKQDWHGRENAER